MWLKTSCTHTHTHTLAAHILSHSLMTTVRAASGEPRCGRWRCDRRLFFKKTLKLALSSVSVSSFVIQTCGRCLCVRRKERERKRGKKGGGEMGVLEGFMGVIMESQRLGHWHWGIFSHPPPIIRWMEQEGVSAATYGWERMACCCAEAQITYFGDRFAFISSQAFIHQAT